MKKIVILASLILFFVPIAVQGIPGLSHKEGLPDPSYGFCYERFPDQPRTFGTCRYLGKGLYTDPVTNKKYSNCPLCEGDCGYGCACTPDCGHPTSEGCQNTPEDEIKCICAGSSCNRPCFFPDGSSCGMWEYFYKCNNPDSGRGKDCKYPCVPPFELQGQKEDSDLEKIVKENELYKYLSIAGLGIVIVLATILFKSKK